MITAIPVELFLNEVFVRNDKGLSPIIGVAVLLIMTIILVSILGFFLYNIAGDVGENQVSTDSVKLENNTIQWISGGSETLSIYVDGNKKDTLDDVGDAYTTGHLFSVERSTGNIIDHERIEYNDYGGISEIERTKEILFAETTHSTMITELTNNKTEFTNTTEYGSSIYAELQQLTTNYNTERTYGVVGETNGDFNPYYENSVIARSFDSTKNDYPLYSREFNYTTITNIKGGETGAYTTSYRWIDDYDPQDPKLNKYSKDLSEDKWSINIELFKFVINEEDEEIIGFKNNGDVVIIDTANGNIKSSFSTTIDITGYNNGSRYIGGGLVQLGDKIIKVSDNNAEVITEYNESKRYDDSQLEIYDNNYIIMLEDHDDDQDVITIWDTGITKN